MSIVGIFLFILYPGVCLAQIFRCPDNWVTYGGSCYLFTFYPYQTYVGAKEACGVHGAALVSVNDRNEHNFIGQWLLENDQSDYRWYTSGIIYDMNAQDLRWEGDGTAVVTDTSYWLNQEERDKPGNHIVYTYGVYQYLWGREPTSTKLPYICEIGQDEAYRILQDNRDFDYGEETSDPNAVPRGPHFLIQPRSLVVVGRALTASFECIAYSNPAPVYKIMRIDDQGIETEIMPGTDTRYTLTNGKLSIQSPDEIQDAGKYQCKAQNEFGLVLSDQMDLTFGMLGEFSNVQRAQVNALEYESAVIACVPPTYKPDLTYNWYKGTSHYVRPDLNPHMFISRNGNLYFSEVSSVDEDDYRCIVKLTANSGAAIGTEQPPSGISLPIPLRVNYAVPSTIDPQIANDFIAVFPSIPKRGENIYMECLAYGTLPLTYSWSRERFPMPPKATLSDHNRVLTIPDAQLEDEGNYFCHVRRFTQAATEKNRTLSIESKPFFSFPLGDQHVDIGSKLTWRCEATARPAATYEWLKDGQIMRSIPGQITINRNVLTIESLAPERDNAMYQCSAQNIHGKTYTEGQLRVLGFVPTFQKRPLEQKIYGAVGGNVTFVCDPEAAPSPTYKWSKNGVDMGLSDTDTTSRIRMLQNGNLLITGLGLADSGYYTCTATNQFGQGSSTGQLEISNSLVITIRPVNTEVIINGTAFMPCQASITRSADYVFQWTLNGREINTRNDLYYIQGTSQLISGLYIRNAQFEHSGYYECIVMTTYDEAKAGAYLTVNGPPGPPGLVYADQGTITATSMYITWNVGASNGRPISYYMIEGKPDIDSEWRSLTGYVIDSSAIVPGADPKKRTYQVSSLKPGLGYQFRVRAANIYGIGLPSGPSDVYQTRTAPPQVAPSGVGGGGGSVGDLTITWLPLLPVDQGGSEVGYIVYWRRLGTEMWTKVLISEDIGKYVTQVEQENYYLQYEVKVQAFNVQGSGPNSTVVTIFSAEDIPIGVVTNVNAWRHNSTALLVTWDEVENTREIMRGTLMGYQVNYYEMHDPDPIINAISWRGEMSSGIIVGLLPNTWYVVDVQLFNTAGLNPISETASQRTLRNAPILYPTEVHVGSDSAQSVYVNWRGVSTGSNEEPLLGYRIWYWLEGDNIRSATEVQVGKVDRTIIHGIQKNNLYKLRILGYSRGGDGTPSQTVYFTLGGLVPFDPAVSDVRATASILKSSLKYQILLSFLCLILLQ